jgi:transketolase
MRRCLGKVLTNLAEQDKSVYLIVGDIGFKVFDEFQEKFPQRFINIGVCEQSMISVAAGMALEGLKPWVYTITPFLIERPFEQIKLDINQQKANVNLVGFSDYPTLGPTHTELDCAKTMSMFKNIQSFFPEDSSEAEQCLYQAYENSGPTFTNLKTDKELGSSLTGRK